MSTFKKKLRLGLDILRAPLDAATVFAGLASYYAGLGMTQTARRSVLRLHCLTNGIFTQGMAPALRALRPAHQPRTVTGLLGEMSAGEQRDLANAIRKNGYYIFEQRLSGPLVDELVAFASRPAFVHGVSQNDKDLHLLDPKAPLGKKYSIPEAEIVRSPAMQRLMGDPSFLAVAEAYLRTHPMIADVTLWWSAVHEGVEGHDAGQNYHFDFETPPGWLMFFFYLTDVDSAHGPHMFVGGSHRPGHPGAASLRRRGYQRITDAEIEAAFGRENVVELLGKRGTILAVDTRGFHKGKPLIEGARLMAQLVYTFPQFCGAHAEKQVLPAQLDPVLAAAIAGTPKVYTKFL